MNNKMILGVGVDIVKTSRFVHWLEKPLLGKRFFIKEELDYIYSKGKEAHISFASHFAAKEAFGKALGCGLAGIRLKDISVRFLQQKPSLFLRGSAKSLFEKRGGKHTHLSLSHEKDNAIALVVIET